MDYLIRFAVILIKNLWDLINLCAIMGSNDFIEFLIDIPKLVYFSDEPCKGCGGSGENNIADGPCCFCGGEGRDKIFDWRKAFEILASLTVVTQFLYINRELVKSQLPQLLIVETITNRDLHGGSLHGEFGPAFRQWLNKFSGHALIKEAEKAMKLAHCKMFHVKQVERFERFDAWVANGGFSCA